MRVRHPLSVVVGTALVMLVVVALWWRTIPKTLRNGASIDDRNEPAFRAIERAATRTRDTIAETISTIEAVAAPQSHEETPSTIKRE